MGNGVVKCFNCGSLAHCGCPPFEVQPSLGQQKIAILETIDRERLSQVKVLAETAAKYPNEDSLNVGDEVSKVGGDYTFEGMIVAAFYKLSGAPRYVVEDDRGVLHVYSFKNLKRK